MNTNIFNPALFAPTSIEVTDADDKNQVEEPKHYAVTGNTSRDSARKLLYEIFSADEANAEEVALIVAAIENQISKDQPDPKSRQYRDVTRAIQIKLKGPRFLELRKGILQGEISVEDACSDDFLSGKKQLIPKPANAPRSGTLVATPIRPGFPKGAPGQAVRPRGMPSGQIFRPPGPKQIIPIRQPLVSQIQHVQDEAEVEQPSQELNIEKRASIASHQDIAQTSQDQPVGQHSQESIPTSTETVPQQASEPKTREPETHQVVYSQSNQKWEQAQLDINTPQFQHGQIENLNDTCPSQSQSFDVSYDATADLSANLDQLRPPTGKGKKTKKKKKKQIHEEEELREESQVASEQVLPNESPLETFPIQNVSQPSIEIAKPVEEQKFQVQLQKDQKIELREEVKEVQPAKRHQEHNEINVTYPTLQPGQNARPIQTHQIYEMKPVMQTERKIPTQVSEPIHQFEKQAERVTPEYASPQLPFNNQGSADSKTDQLMAENQRLRQQLRQGQVNEDQLLAQSHQIQLLQGQLKNREEQVIALRWQLQQQQITHQSQLDEVRLRLSNVQLESQQFREHLSTNRHSQPSQQFTVPDFQREQLIARNQQQSVQQHQIRTEEMAADRGSNFLGGSFQHAGNQVNSGEVTENNFESGEADEGGRDDGHFYRNTTADEGTGGAGESYQQRVVDGVSSGSGQMPSNAAVSYQRFEQVYGTSEDVHELHPEEDEDDEDAYQNQYFAQNENAQLTSQSHLSQNRQHVNQNARAQYSSSGSAFGEGNQQDDSEEGMGMGMGNRQGSGHDVEDESGSLDVVAQNSGYLQTLQNQFHKNYHSQQQRQFVNENIQANSSNANNQGEIFEPVHDEIPEMGDDNEDNHSVGEEGGRSEGRDDLNEAMYNQMNLAEFNQPDPDETDLYDETTPRNDHTGNPNYTRQGEESGSNQGSDEDDSYYEKQQQLGAKRNPNSGHGPQLSFMRGVEEEEKGESDRKQNNSPQSNALQQRSQAAIGDNVERPQPYHPRQQHRSQNVTGQQNPGFVSTGGAAVFMSQGLSQQNQQQNAFMQGECNSTNYQQERSSAPSQSSNKNSIGGVAVATRRGNPPVAPNSKQPATPLAKILQAGERPGPSQRRGNKQQFQVPPLPPSSTANPASSNTKGQGQGGGEVGQNQSTSLTRTAGRNSRGTQRTNLQQQFIANAPNQIPSDGHILAEINLQSQSQSSRPPASQASSAAQLPLGKQNPQTSAGGATGGIQNQRQQNASVYNDEGPSSHQSFNLQQQLGSGSGTGNNQSSNVQSIGAISQASTMPASQASASGSASLRQQQHNGGGPIERHQNYLQSQSAVAMNHSARQDGVVLTANSQQQFNQFQGQSLVSGNTQAQALGGAMMGSSGSVLMGGDIGGLTERTNRGVNSNLSQMNAESGSTAEFTSIQRNYPQFMGSGGVSNVIITSQNQQFVSPPSTLPQGRGGLNGQMQYQHLQSSQQSLEHVNDGISTSGSAEAEFYGAVNVPPQNHSSRGAISSAQPQGNFFQGQNGRSQQQKVSGYGQQQSLFQGGNIQKGSGSGEAEQTFGHSALQQQTQVDSNQAHHNHIEDARIGVTHFEQQKRTPPIIARNFQHQQQEQARTDSRKTSGANTPSKDGADTPPYRDQVINNSFIMNLTSKTLQQLEPRLNAPNDIQDPVVARPHEAPVSNPRSVDPNQHEEHKVIPKNMFE